MITRIDDKIKEYMKKLVETPDLKFDDVKKLMDCVREAYDFDMVFLAENKKYIYAFEFTYASVKDGIDLDRRGSLYIKSKEYEELLNKSENDKGVCFEKVYNPLNISNVMYYGLISNDYYYGSVGFCDIKGKRVWTEEEKEALRKISRVIFYFVSIDRRKLDMEKEYITSKAAMNNNSISGYYVDFKEDIYHGFRIVDYLQDFIPEWGKYSEILKKYCDNMVDPGYARQVLRNFSISNLRNMLSEKMPVFYMEYPRSINNRIRWFRITATFISKDQSGNTNNVAVVIDDITNSVTKNDKSYYAFELIKENYLGIYSVDLSTDRFAAISTDTSDFDGKDGEVGKFTEHTMWLYANRVHKNDKEIFKAFFDIRSLDIKFSNSNKPISFDYRRLLVNGYTWIRVELIPNIDYGENNKRVTIFLKDISSEVASQDQLISLANSLRSIYFSAYTISLKDYSFTEINSAEEYTYIATDNMNAKEFLETMVDELVVDDYKESMRKFVELDTIEERLTERKNIVMEFLRENKGWCRGEFIPTKWDENGKISTVIYAAADIDEEKRKENEKQLEIKRANIAKTDFLSRMSHDIRTPMNAIMGMTAIAINCLNSPDKMRDCLGKIDVSSRHLMALINEVLDMNKIESGNMSLDCEKFSLIELVKNLLNMIHSQIESSGHEFYVFVNNIVHDDVYGDSLRLQQIFMNIVGNAIKYTPKGGKISLSVTELPMTVPGRGGYEFVFEDNGIGMSEDFISKVFDPFAREEDSRINKIQGTGLGMSIVKKIVELMDGKINVESKKGIGTKFTVDIQIDLQNVEETDTKILRGKKILVIGQDDIDLLKITREMQNYDVFFERVSDRIQAVDKIKEAYSKNDNYLAVFFEMNIYDKKSFEFLPDFCEKLGEMKPSIVAFSHGWKLDNDLSMINYIDDYIGKPLQKQSVIKLLKRLSDESLSETKNITEASKLKSKNYNGKKVLLVEDQDFNREIATEFLEMTGVTVYQAEDGKEAVDIVAKSQDGFFDFIFMDIQMPNMNGYDATRAIRAMRRNDVKKMPIVAMTANAFAEDINDAKSAGMNEHLAKPIDLEKLENVLSMYLE